MVTVFTPSYNRGYKIESLYKSLLSQDSYDFEWIIVDDASTDNTEELINDILCKDNPFKITYRKVKHGGKHRAVNVGVNLANGEYFFIVDSDDTITKDAIGKINEWFKTLDQSKKFAGVAGLKLNILNKSLPTNINEYVDAKNNERHKYHLDADQAEIYFTDVLKAHPFPEFDGEDFLLESAVWSKLALEGYYIRWFFNVIYVFEYLDDGLTKSTDKYKNNPKGLLYCTKYDLLAYRNSTKTKMSLIKRYIENTNNKSTKDIAKELDCNFCFIKFVKLVMKVMRK